MAVKTTEIAIFGAALLLLMSIMGIDLTALVVVGGALGVGIGLGLQQIAANFSSGSILLVEGQTTVGDHVEPGGGERGTIARMTARSCVPQTFDRRRIVMPNEHFITTRVVTCSDADSPNQHQALFFGSCDTDINLVPGTLGAAVFALPFVLQNPHGPDCALRVFGGSAVDFAVDFAVEYRAIGSDDGKPNYASPVLFAIWDALEAAGVGMPDPHRVAELKQPVPAGLAHIGGL